MKCVRDRKTLMILVFFALWIHGNVLVSFSLFVCVMADPPPTELFIEECKEHGDRWYNNKGPSFAWGNIIQTFLLAAFGYGYFAAQLPSGWVVGRIGPRWMVFTCCMTSSVANVLIPVCAELHWSAVFIIRLLVGLVAGTFLASLQSLLVWWIPPDNRNISHRIIKLGALTGFLVAWILTGTLLLVLEWTYCLYIQSALACLIGLLWLFVIRDKPGDRFEPYSQSLEDIIPLKTAIASCPLIALTLLNFGSLTGLTFFLLLAPKFIYEVLGLGIFLTSLISSLPILLRLLSSIIFELLVNRLLSRNVLDRTATRKLFVILSHLFTGLCVAILGYVGCNIGWTMATLCVAGFFSGVSSVTNLVNCQDLSPTYSFVIFILVNFIGLAATFLLPQFAGYILATQYSLLRWRHVFWVVAAIYLVTGILFLIFGSAQVQPWNFPHLYYMAAFTRRSMMSVAYATRDQRRTTYAAVEPVS